MPRWPLLPPVSSMVIWYSNQGPRQTISASHLLCLCSRFEMNLYQTILEQVASSCPGPGGITLGKFRDTFNNVRQEGEREVASSPGNNNKFSCGLSLSPS